MKKKLNDVAQQYTKTMAAPPISKKVPVPGSASDKKKEADAIALKKKGVKQIPEGK